MYFGLTCLLVAVILVALWIGLQFLPSKTIPDPLPGILPGCFLRSTLNTSKVVVCGALIGTFQAIYFALTMYKLFIRVKSLGFCMTPLLKVFFRDRAGYCLIYKELGCRFHQDGSCPLLQSQYDSFPLLAPLPHARFRPGD
ncbi:hypothetical protein JB92DRAFT_2834810 [Gautieria morchelliformis]|nr:hypothetical protein JB92DRAFT_2834810 [Gautieria morchelliformis]